MLKGNDDVCVCWNNVLDSVITVALLSACTLQSSFMKSY